MDTAKGKGKLKKRDYSNVSKSKKPNAKRQKDGAHLNKQGVANKENRKTISAPVVGLNKSQCPPSLCATTGGSRLGYLKTSRAKVSETVSARKVLGSLQLPPNTDNCATSQEQLQLDLQRVLGKPEPMTSTSTTRPGSPPHPMTPPSPPPPLPNGSSTGMEISPGVAMSGCVPLAKISKHIVEGLQVDVIFPDSTYLRDIKAELRKVFKQCNPCSYEELVGYFSGSGVGSPVPSPTPPPAPPLPPAPPMFTHTFTEPISNVVDISNPPPLAPSADSHVTGHVTDLVALNLEVNTSALNINDRVTPEEDGRTTYDLRPRDFLDLLDNTPTADHNLGPQDTSLSSPPDWSTTPTRPRLFPHKLY